MTHQFDSPGEAAEAYARWVARTGYSDATQALYAAKVARFAEFLAGDSTGEYAEALADPFVRDYAVRDFRRDLLTAQKAAVSTVETYMASIRSFYEWMGLGKPNVSRMPTRKPDPKALDDDQLRRVLRAAERRGARDFALAMTLYQTAIRVSECVALNTDDLFLSDRMGQLEVRYGKGGQPDTKPIPADARAALRAWLAVRRSQGAPEVGPLWIARGGGRLSKRRVQSLMDDLAKAAGGDVELSPHVMRHTFARQFLANGGDVGELQQFLGHKNLASTQVYTRAKATVLAESAERVRIDL